MSDPWSGTTSPQIDPWQPSKHLAGAVGVTPETWMSQRTQSPSVGSGSSNEGWLQNNTTPTGGMLNGNNPMPDTWLGGKSNANGHSGLNQMNTGPPPPTTADPWLGKGAILTEKTIDPWLSKAPNADPWAPPAPHEVSFFYKLLNH